MGLWFVAMLACSPVSSPPSSNQLTLAYTTNVDGEIEPCG